MRRRRWHGQQAKRARLENDEEEDEEGEGKASKKKTKTAGEWKRTIETADALPQVTATLTFNYVACNLLQEPVVAHDLIR